MRTPHYPQLSAIARGRALLARPWSARCYGVARHREGSRQNSIGSPACSLSGISGWFSLSVGAWVPKESGAAKFRFIGFGDAMLLGRLGPPGRGRGCRPHDAEVAGGAVADLV